MIPSAPPISHEFFLAAACCIWPPSERRTAAIREAATQRIDWEGFLRVVKRQRVAGLVHDGLKRAGVAVPPAIGRGIGAIATRIAHQNLQFAAESVRIQQLFDDAGVAILFVKGTTLAQLAYGSTGIKHSWDVDVLVTPEAVPEALRILEQAGYRAFPPLPATTDKRYRRWLRFTQEYVLYHETNPVVIELHWRLATNRHFLSGISAASPARTVSLSKRAELRTLGDPDLFTYLCVHGAMHGWSRLKWLADVAALIARDTVGDAENRLDAARKVNAEHCVVQAFILCDRIFGTPNLADLSRRLRHSFRYRWLERTALRAMMNGNAETELEDESFGFLAILMSHFLFGRGWRFAADELWNKLNRPYDLWHVALPTGLGFLYPLVRVALWITRRGRVRAIPTPSRTWRLEGRGDR